MKKRIGKISVPTLLIVTIITILMVTIELSVIVQVKAPYYVDKISAAQHTARAFAIIRNTVDSLFIPIDKVNDPNETGLVGTQFSPITIERGDLNAKLTATNPNITAMLVHLIKQAHIYRDDTIAVSITGSTPALNIALYVALETIGTVPVVITSVSSSMWGANYPQLTMLDMEHILFESGAVSTRMIAATVGGHDETGRGMSPEGRMIIASAATRNGIDLLLIPDLESAIKKRMELYMNSGTIKGFINVCEQPNALSGFDIVPGIIPAYSMKQGNGLVPQFSQLGITVINLTNINQMAVKYGIPVAPQPLPDIGTGILFYEHRNSVVLAIIFLFVLIIILFVMLRYDIDSIWRRSQK